MHDSPGDSVPSGRGGVWSGGDATTAAVLIIKDDDCIRLSLQLALPDEGYAATGAATAEDGFTAQQRRRPAETVLVDLMLRGLDGFQCIRQLRRADDVPIV